MERLIDKFLNMAYALVWAILGVVFYPLILLIFFVITLTALGWSIGIRKIYIKLLLIVFEWGTNKIKENEKKRDEINGNSTKATEEYETQTTLEPTSLKPENSENKSSFQRLESIKHEFKLDDALYFYRSGLEAIIDDKVTKSFAAAELPSWNLLTRTNNHHEFISYKLTTLWFVGCFVRYFLLFPLRVSLTISTISSLIIGNTLIGYLPGGKLKTWLNYRLNITCMRLASRAFSAVIRFHDKHNKAKPGGICVANHTSPIDIVILGCDNCYAMVGQQQQGLFGMCQNAFARASAHIWFQRSESKDREAVANRLKKHVSDLSKLPILIFPEGTCINNTTIMMFKKGSFEVGGTIYPAAIKYDSRFADPFWDSSRFNFVQHLMSILTSWALVVDVWYLPPQTQGLNESSVDFANRVKQLIAERGGLVDLDWDGALKRSQPKPVMLQKQQENFSKRLKAE